MVEQLEWPLQFRRQYAGAIDSDAVFDTIAALNDYLTNPLRYAGQLVTCVETPGAVFILNTERDQWLPVSGGGGGVKWINITTATTTIKNHGYLLAGNFALTLPADPEVGDIVAWRSLSGVQTLQGGTKRIEGELTPLVATVGTSGTMVYQGEEYGWVNVTGNGAGGGGSSEVLSGYTFPTPSSVPGQDRQFYLDLSTIEKRHMVSKWVYLAERGKWYPTSEFVKLQSYPEDVSVAEHVAFSTVAPKQDDLTVAEHLVLDTVARKYEDLTIEEHVTFTTVAPKLDDLSVAEHVTFTTVAPKLDDLTVDEHVSLHTVARKYEDLTVAEDRLHDIVARKHDDVTISEYVRFILKDTGNSTINAGTFNSTTFN